MTDLGVEQRIADVLSKHFAEKIESDMVEHCGECRNCKPAECPDFKQCVHVSGFILEPQMIYRRITYTLHRPKHLTTVVSARLLT